MVKKEQAIDLILDMFDTNLFPPERSWPEHEFMQRAIARWAASSLIKTLCVEKEEDDAIRIITGFRNRMDEFAGYDPGRGRCEIFIIAADLADRVIALLKQRYERNNIL